MIINVLKGNIFATYYDVLVNPVNCVGIMGKGLAKVFKVRFDSYYKAYCSLCRQERVRIGECLAYGTNPTIISFPTKVHWRDNSNLEWITSGLHSLRQLLLTPYFKDKTIAIPALGCGEGGLDWKDVEPLIKEKLDGLSNIISLFEPL